MSDNVDDDNGDNVDDDNGENVDDDNGHNVDEDNGNTAISSQYFQGETKSQSNGDNSKAGHEGDEIPDNSFIESKRNNVYDILKGLKLRNVNRLVIGNLNINSIASKFDQLKAIIQCHVDILVIVETKLDITFPTSQFLLDGFSKPYRLDRNRNGGGILIYVREDIRSKLLLKHNFPDDIEGIFIEINLRKIKWLLFGTYHPPSQADNYYFDSITRALDIYGRLYTKFLLIGDFNAEENETCMSAFLYQHNLKNLVKHKTCFKSTDNSSCIDLFLTNCANSFQNTTTISAGISDCHNMVVTVLKTTFTKKQNLRKYFIDVTKTLTT